MYATNPTPGAAFPHHESAIDSCPGRAPWPIAVLVLACAGTARPQDLSSRRFSFRPLAALVMTASLLLGFSAPAATVVWNWAGGDRNWSTALNWIGGVPESTNVVIFNNTDAQVDTSTVNTVDASTTVSSLSYTNFSATTYSSFQNTRPWPAGRR